MVEEPTKKKKGKRVGGSNPKQLRMFPETEQEKARHAQPRKTGTNRWYYIKDAQSNRMRGVPGDGLGLDWFPLDLRNASIMLFSAKCTAKREAFRCGGLVIEYPFCPSTLRESF